MILKILIAALAVYFGWRFLYGGAVKPRASATDRLPFPDHRELEACALLGVQPGASADTIRAAHRRLILLAHPDRGGSPELSRQLNAARDYLLKVNG